MPKIRWKDTWHQLQEKPFKCEFCDYRCDMKRHLVSLCELKKPLKCKFMFTAMIWKRMWYQFMNEKKIQIWILCWHLCHRKACSYISCREDTIQMWSKWYQFMKKTRHSNIKFLITVVTWKSIWCSVLRIGLLIRSANVYILESADSLLYPCMLNHSNKVFWVENISFMYFLARPFLTR